MSQSDSKKGGFYRTRRELDLEEKKRRREALPIKYDKYWNPEEHTLTNTQIAALESMGCERHKILLRCKNALLKLNGRNMPDKFQEVEKNLKYQRDREIFTVNYWDKLYPNSLDRLKLEAPPLLHYKGNIFMLDHPDSVYIYSQREECSIEVVDMLAPEYKYLVANIEDNCDRMAALRYASRHGAVIALTKYDVDYTLKHQMRFCSQILDAGGIVVSPVARGLAPCFDGELRNLQIALSETIVTAHELYWRNYRVREGMIIKQFDSPFAIINGLEAISNCEVAECEAFNRLFYSGELDNIGDEEKPQE